MNKPRLLKPDEISCRVQSLSENKTKGTVGAVILLYKDARVDMAILDETFGPMNWQREHIEIGGKMFCTIAVWDEDKNQWISKQDVGVESNTEATKGEASDSFKRSGTNWGIGRELYTAPFIYIQLEAAEWYVDQQSGKPKTKPGFIISVKEIKYNDNRKIVKLVLIDKKNRVRFPSTQWEQVDDAEIPPEKVKEPVKVTMTITPEELAQRKREVAALQKDYNISPEKLKEITVEMDCKKLNEMTAHEYADFILALRERVA